MISMLLIFMDMCCQESVLLIVANVAAVVRLDEKLLVPGS